MTIQIMPFVPSIPLYQVGVTIASLDLTGSYLFDLRWNARDSAWRMDVSEADGTPIVSGVKIVLGTYLGRRSPHPLFRQGAFVAIDTTGTGTEATLDSLGASVIVQYMPAEDLMAAVCLATPTP